MSYLAIEQVAKSFSGKTVLRDITLDLAEGEFVSLLGPSGCGKTTLLRIVAGFETPDQGRLVLGGKDITTLPPARRQMGMVFQAYSLFPNMTAEENVRFGLKVRRIDAGAQGRRAADLLALVGLAEHAQKFPHQLSGGQQQRVALARALAIQPALLLLDEPLSALDAKVRVQLREEIRRIQQETKVTTIFVTHDQEEALSISDRVVVMHDGELSQVGRPETIYGEPENIFVARFLGAVSELSGRVVNGGEGVVDVLGHRVRATRARGMATGTEVYFLLRPETIRVRPGEAANTGSGDFALDGTVTGRTFFGALTSLRIDLDRGFHVTASMPSGEAGPLDHGARVSVTWDEHAPRLIEALPQAAE